MQSSRQLKRLKFEQESLKRKMPRATTRVCGTNLISGASLSKKIKNRWETFQSVKNTSKWGPLCLTQTPPTSLMGPCSILGQFSNWGP